MTTLGGRRIDGSVVREFPRGPRIGLVQRTAVRVWTATCDWAGCGWSAVGRTRPAAAGELARHSRSH